MHSLAIHQLLTLHNTRPLPNRSGDTAHPAAVRTGSLPELRGIHTTPIPGNRPRVTPTPSNRTNLAGSLYHKGVAQASNRFAPGQCLAGEGDRSNDDTMEASFVDNDDQIGFALDFDDKTRAWLDWVAPEHMDTRIRAFLAVTVPELPADAEWWQQPHSTQIMKAAIPLFGDWAGFTAAENHDLADGYIRFQGECYVRRAGYGWMNVPEWGPPLYTDIGPTVRLGNDHVSDVAMMIMAQRLFRDDDGPEMIEYNITEAVRRARRTRSAT